MEPLLPHLFVLVFLLFLNVYWFFLWCLEPSYLQFFGDDFLRLLLLRYVFCDVVLHLHRGFKGRQYRPRCQPPLPEAELLEHPSLQHLVLDLAAHLEVRSHFLDTNEMDWSRAASSWPFGIRATTHEDGRLMTRRRAPPPRLLLLMLVWALAVSHRHHRRHRHRRCMTPAIPSSAAIDVIFYSKVKATLSNLSYFWTPFLQTSAISIMRYRKVILL